MSVRRAARTAALLLTAAALAGCGAGTSVETAEQQATAAPATRSAPDTSAQTSAPTAAVPADPAVRILDVTFAGGSVTGVDPRVSVELGEELVLRVTSDVADEVHVHGYDLYGDVPAGGTVEIPLTATIPGGFEVELERTGKTLFQLRVA